MPTFKHYMIDEYVDGLDFVDDARFRYIKVSKKVYSSLRGLPRVVLNPNIQVCRVKVYKRANTYI